LVIVNENFIFSSTFFYSCLEKPFINGMREGNVAGINVVELELPYSNSDSFCKRTWTFIKFALKSVRIALCRQYDILFATTTPLTAGIPGIFAKILRRKPFVFEVRDLWPELPKAMGVITNPVVLLFMSWLEWCSYHSADMCIGLAPGIVKGIIKRGVPKEKVALVPNGCDLKIFRENPVTVKGWRPEGIKDTDLMAVFTGAHGVANGLDSVLDAALILRERNRDDIKLVFVGDGKLKPKLEIRAKTSGLRNCIFLNAVPKTELSGLLACADIGLMILANVEAFYYGTSPNKFFDYIASGKPVLNNYPGWLAEMIKENKCGYTVVPDNPDKFADALVHAADNRQALQEMGVRARVLAERAFDRNILSDNFCKILENQWKQT
jgi:glycosyltransferase involved in cell wall biosynthesis